MERFAHIKLSNPKLQNIIAKCKKKNKQNLPSEI